MKKFKEFLREEQEEELDILKMPFEDAEAHANMAFTADPGGIFKRFGNDMVLNYSHPAIKFLHHGNHTEKSLDNASDHLLKLAKREVTGEQVKSWEPYPDLVRLVRVNKENRKFQKEDNKKSLEEEYEVYLDTPTGWKNLKKKKKKRTKKKAKKYTSPYYGFSLYGYNNNTDGESGSEGGGDGGGGE